MADEVQTGIARTGSMLAVCGNCTCGNTCTSIDLFKPDLLILGKALSGGVYPRAVGDDTVMEATGQHGSTFGGNPIAAEVAMAVEVVKEEGLAPHARELGVYFREKMNDIIAETDLVTKVRGKGLLNAIIINDI